jgi:hypothetical protein
MEVLQAAYPAGADGMTRVHAQLAALMLPSVLSVDALAVGAESPGP